LGNAIARQFYQELLAGEVGAIWPLQLVERGYRRLCEIGQRGEPRGLRQAVAAAATAMFPECRQIGSLPGKQVIVFIGPAGVGKTTLIAKLAATCLC